MGARNWNRVHRKEFERGHLGVIPAIFIGLVTLVFACIIAFILALPLIILLLALSS